jgi:drug/metabolite transporter (DMT)-like permease
MPVIGYAVADDTRQNFLLRFCQHITNLNISSLTYLNKQFLIHGVIPGLVSALALTTMVSLVKLASAELSSQQLVFFRTFFGLLIITPIVFQKGIQIIKTTKLKFHILRGVIGVTSMSCMFYAISQIGLSEATLLNSTSPLFIGLLARWLLREELSRLSMFALPLGFIGAALILKPGTELFNIAAVVGLASGFFVAGAKIIIRYMSTTEPVLRTVFYFSLISTIYAAVPMLWMWETPSHKVIFIMLLASLCATAGQFFMTYMFTHNEAIKVAPFSYVTVMLATLVAWMIWNELPDMGSMFGIVLVIVSCLMIGMQKKRSADWEKDVTA